MGKNYGYEQENSAKDLLSDFNEAKFQVFRLHLLWQQCNLLSQHGNLRDWKWKLDIIWRELTPDAKQKDKETYFSKVKELNTDIQKAIGKEKMYNALQEKEIFLRCLQDEVGKGSKRSSSDLDDIDG